MVILRNFRMLHFAAIGILLIYLTCEWFSNSSQMKSDYVYRNVKDVSTNAEIYRYLAKENLIILSTTDNYYLRLALNLHKSLVKFNIKNYIFGCTDLDACLKLRKRNIQAVNIGNDAIGKGFTRFRSKRYNTKTYYKTEAVLDVLRAGVSVLFVDSDCVFLQDPLPYIENYSDYDIATTREYGTPTHNSGVYLAHPTNATIELHEKMIYLQEKQMGSNQQIMNYVIKIMNDKLKITLLGNNTFYGGREYFYQENSTACCSFAYDKCCPRSNAVMLHNNIAFTRGTKIYRFKEQLMWYMDINRYYISTERKYLLMTFQQKCFSTDEQANALKNGLQLASILNRTLILPAFSCDMKDCNFIDKFGTCIGLLDKMVGTGYREHMFLENPLVPEKTRKSVIKQLDIQGIKGLQNENRLSNFAKDFLLYKEYSVIQVSIPCNISFNFDEQLTKHLELLDGKSCIPRRLKISIENQRVIPSPLNNNFTHPADTKLDND